MGLLKGPDLARTIMLLAIGMLSMLWGHPGRPVMEEEVASAEDVKGEEICGRWACE